MNALAPYTFCDKETAYFKVKNLTQTILMFFPISFCAPCMDKLKQAGQNLARVYNFSHVHALAPYTFCDKETAYFKVENLAQATFRFSFISLHAPPMDKHKQARQNLARVFNFSHGHAFAQWISFITEKLSNS